MNTSPVTAEGLPIVRVSPRPPEHAPGWQRLRPAVVAANGLAAALGILGMPIALFAPMNLGMSYGAASGFKDDAWGLFTFELTALVAVGFPFLCAACIGISLSLGRRGRDRPALAVALVPPAVCLVLLAMGIAAELLTGRSP